MAAIDFGAQAFADGLSGVPRGTAAGCGVAAWPYAELEPRDSPESVTLNAATAKIFFPKFIPASVEGHRNTRPNSFQQPHGSTADAWPIAAAALRGAP